MEPSPLDVKSNLEKLMEIFSREDLLLRIKIFFGYNVLMSVYYLYLVMIAVGNGLIIPALYITLLSFLTFLGVGWLATLKNLPRQIFLIFSLFDFFVMAVLSPGNIIILLNVIYRVWILGVNGRSLKFFN